MLGNLILVGFGLAALVVAVQTAIAVVNGFRPWIVAWVDAYID